MHLRICRVLNTYLSELGALVIILIQRVTDMGLELTSKDHLISLYSKAGSHIPG